LALKVSKLNTFTIPKYTQTHDLLKLDKVHELAHSLNDIQSMLDKEIDRQNGNAEKQKVT